VKPGASLSLQMHHHRSEHWVVVSGEAEVVNGEAQLRVRANESTYIPARNKHRLANPGKDELVLIEVADRFLSWRGRHRAASRTATGRAPA